jgi:cytochrome c-type biogenesis protein CcmH
VSRRRRTTRLPASPLLPLLLLLLGSAGRLAAQEPMRVGEPPADPSVLSDSAAARLDAHAAEIAAKLRCPVCTGQSVLESNSGIAQEMQSVIRERLAAGRTEDEILDYFVGSYGDWIILKPPATGLNLLVYILPAAVLVAGGLWVFTRVRGWSRAASAGGGGSAEDAGLTPDDEAWLRESLGGR